MSVDEPNWLNTEEHATWLAMIRVLTRLPAALDADLQHSAGLSFFEYQVLAGLSMRHDRTRRMSELAEFSACSLSRLSHTARRLESKGWLYRKPDPCDGRYTLAVLTDAGWDKVVATAPGHVAQVRRLLFGPLTRAQYKQLRQISERIEEAIASNPCPEQNLCCEPPVKDDA